MLTSPGSNGKLLKGQVGQMYKLTERMLQRFENDLRKYHELFSGKRCETWNLEELIFKAINIGYPRRPPRELV